MAANGTEDYPQLAREDREAFEGVVSGDQLHVVVENLKHAAAVEAQAAGFTLSDDAMAEFCMPHVRIGSPLPQPTRQRLSGYVTELQALDRRIEAARTLATLKHEPTPKPSKGGKRKPAKNAARDAWVAKQREKRQPPTWAEIYDDLVKVAAARGWSAPSGPRALEEAYRRYLGRTRKSEAG